MQQMRESWTDARLDDLNVKVDRGFERLDTDLRGLRAEMRARFDKADERIDRKLDSLGSRIDRLSAILVGASVTLIAALVGSNLITI